MAEIVYVNEHKKGRAELILAWLAGTKTPNPMLGEHETKSRFANMLAEAKIDPQGADALPFVYEKLGGLARTPAEHAAAEQKAVETKKKARKQRVEL